MAIETWVAAGGTLLALGNVVGGLQLTGYLRIVELPHQRLALLHRTNGAVTLALLILFGYLTGYGGEAWTAAQAGVMVLGLVGYGGKVVVVSLLDRAYSLGGVFGIVILVTWLGALWTSTL